MKLDSTRRDTLKLMTATAGGLVLPVKSQVEIVQAVSAFSPGGMTEQFFRPLWLQAQEALGKKVVIEYKPGATGAIALSHVAKAAPDGHTLLQFYSSMLLTPYMEATSYDLLRDFTFIIALADVVYGVAVASTSKYKTFEDLMVAAKAQPGKLNYAVAGLGTGGHIMFEEALHRRGVNMVSVPYKGVEYLPALIGGHIDCAVGSTSWGPQARSGVIKPLAYFTRERIPTYPDVPSSTDLGFDINDPYPLGIIGPKGMATATVQKLHDALKAAIETPAMEKVMYDAATPKLYMNTADFTTWAHKAFVTKGQTMTRIGLAKRQPRK